MTWKDGFHRIIRACPVIIFLLWIVQACKPFGKPVNKELSTSYYYGRSGKSIIYSPGGNWFELGQAKMEGVDVETFRVVSNTIAKDKDRVYRKSGPVDFKVDLETFRISNKRLMSDQPVDKDHVYAFDKEDNIYIIEGADPVTYERLDYWWSKDANYYFYQNKLIMVDYDSFEVLNGSFCKDQDNVYTCSSKAGVTKIEADVASIAALDDQYVTDKNNVYRYTGYVRGSYVDALKIMPYKDIEKVRVLDDVYLEIGSRIYSFGDLLNGVEAEHFRILSPFFAKDEHHGYYHGILIEGSHGPTFEFIDVFYSKDTNNVYFKDKMVEGADPTSFKKKEGWYYYTDGKNKYHEGKKLLKESGDL